MDASYTKRLVEARKQAGASQAKIATKIGVSRGAYSLYELGLRKPDLDTCKKIAEFHNMTIDQLFFGNEETPSAPAPTGTE